MPVYINQDYTLPLEKTVSLAIEIWAFQAQACVPVNCQVASMTQICSTMTSYPRLRFRKESRERPAKRVTHIAVQHVNEAETVNKELLIRTNHDGTRASFCTIKDQI